MKKHGKFRYIAIIAILIISALCLVACGTNGADGKNGIDGKSAYEIWLDNGHTGSQTDFLDWLKGNDGKNGQDGQDGQDGTNGNDGQDGQDGTNGKSSFEIFMQYYPYYTGTEQDWINGLINGQLHVYTVTFKSEVSDDIVKHVFQGYDLTDIPEVPEKEGQASATWNTADFTNITQDMTVNAVYVMQTRTVTFHNEFTDDEDVVKTVEYGQAITDIPTVTTKEYNDAYWEVGDFGSIKTDMTVNAIYETRGLQYTPINKQTQYRVSKGEMNRAAKELFIPAEHNGKPVTVIDQHAFEQIDVNSVFIPDTITEIRNDAFQQCRVTSVTLGKNVNFIDSNAFANTFITDIHYRGDISSWCGISGIGSLMGNKDDNKLYIDGKEIIELIIPDTVKSIESYAFAGCYNITNITIPNGVTSLGSWTFEYCTNLGSIELPNSVTTIEDGVFSGCSSLTSVTIPNSISFIKMHVFSGCTQLSTIYYKGTQEQFRQIFIQVGNNSFTDSMVYFYSETEPQLNSNGAAYDDYYWHYDTDGITPVVWVKENQ